MTTGHIVSLGVSHSGGVVNRQLCVAMRAVDETARQRFRTAQALSTCGSILALLRKGYFQFDYRTRLPVFLINYVDSTVLAPTSVDVSRLPVHVNTFPSNTVVVYLPV